MKHQINFLGIQHLSIVKHVFEFADQLSQKTGCCVIMPDFFRNNPCPFDLIPPDSPTKQEKLTQWLNSTATKEIALNDSGEHYLPISEAKYISIFPS